MPSSCAATARRCFGTSRARSRSLWRGRCAVAGYDLETGKEVWTVWGIVRTVCATPVIGNDNRLYLAGWSAGGDPGSASGVGAVRHGHQAAGQKRQREAGGQRDNHRTDFRAFQPGGCEQGRFNHARRVRALPRPVRQGAECSPGDQPRRKGERDAITRRLEEHEACALLRSPLFHSGIVYTIKDGGFLATLDARDGKLLKRDRVPGSGNYYSSPVAGDGKIYLLSDVGQLTVVRAAGEWEVLSTSSFAEEAHATPAIADGRIYLRTAGHLWCFGLSPKQ